MSTDNKSTASGSGKLVLGIAIGCGCSLLMALVLVVVVVVAILYGFTSRAVPHRGVFVSTSSECVPLFPPHLVPATSVNESYHQSSQTPFVTAESPIEPVKPGLPFTIVETEQKSSVAETVE